MPIWCTKKAHWSKLRWGIPALVLFHFITYILTLQRWCNLYYLFVTYSGKMRQESLLKDQSSTAKFLPTWSQIKTELVKSRRKVKKIRTGDPQFWWTALLWLLSLQFSKDFCESKILTIVLFLIPDLLFTVSFEMNYIIILLNFGTSHHWKSSDLHFRLCRCYIMTYLLSS